LPQFHALENSRYRLLNEHDRNDLGIPFATIKMKLPLWLKISLGCGALVVGLLLAAFIGLLVYVLRTQHAYKNLPDTHDLKSRVDQMAATYAARRPNAGIVIAVYQRGNRYVKGAGQLSTTNTNVPDARTLFEIGSITKVFTAVVLAKMAGGGAVKLNDPISLYLPKGVASPLKNGHEITLENLATHASGLPRLPANLPALAQDQQNPYANYKAADLYASLATVQLESEPGKKSSYSNYGFGLLGHLLTLKAGQPYETLVRDTVCAPLGLSNTVIQLSPEQRSRLAQGHDTKGHPVSNWDFDVMAPAGGLRSDAEDLLRFVAANLAPDPAPLFAALTETQKMHFKQFSGGMALGWHIAEPVEQNTVLWKNGGTGGYISFIGFDRANQVGVVILSSSGDAMVLDSSVDRMGMELLKLAVKVSLE
jgi:CubicO group peptidase (beta-lactamase class C family)